MILDFEIFIKDPVKLILKDSPIIFLYKKYQIIKIEWGTARIAGEKSSYTIPNSSIIFWL